MKTITMRSVNCRSGMRFSWTAPNNKIIITKQKAAQNLIAKYPNAKVSKAVSDLLQAV